MAEEFITVKEFAAIVRVHRNTVLNQIARGSLKAVRIGGVWRIPQSALKDLPTQKQRA